MISPTTPGHVFISYDRDDQPYTRKLADSLRQRGFEVWMDDRIDFGDRWWREIVKAVRASAAFVVVMTPDSEQSEWVEREILLAQHEGKPIFPLLLRGHGIPLLVTTQYANVTGGRMPPDDFYERLEREIRAPSKKEIIEPPEATVRKERVWQRLRLRLAVVGLLSIVLLVGVVACGLVGDGEAIKPTVPQPPSNASLGDIWTRPADGMEMVYVPGGTFEMGSTEGFDDEQPVHAVTLDSFWIDKTEVTNDQFERFVQATDYHTDAEKEGTGEVYSDGSWSEVDGADWQHPNGLETSILDRMDHPVVQVTWTDATTYCQWAGGRLPTEAEWEYAARGPDGHIYPWGNNTPDNALLNYNEDVGDTTQVGSYPAGASWVGAMDMAGNVWEWVADWYDGDYYASSPSQNPKGPETRDEKVVRGGGWSVSGAGVRAASRYHPLPDDRVDALGFRCVVAYAPPSDASLHDTWIRPADDMEMVYVPGGTFQMGSTDAEIDAAFEQCEQDHGSGECQRSWFEQESPQHLVTLDAFWVDKTEVTNAQFERFVRDTNYRTDAEKEGTGWVYSDGDWSEVDGADWQHPNGPETSISERMDHPVVQVSWNDADVYCQWARGRLPTEAEWEYAVRGPEGHIYPWGDTFDGELANYCDANCPLDWHDANYDDGYEWTAPVGNYPAGASWVGVLDMAGNVWEWVNDWYDGYPGTTYQTDRFGTTDKVARGGSWDNSGEGVRAANRTHGPPGVRYDLLGLRCVVEPGD